MIFYYDRNGVQLADVPGSGTSRVATTQRSGNKLHDTRSGKFGAGGAGARPRQLPNQNVDPVEYARMYDAVREAAREFDDPSEGDLREFLKGRARAPEQVDLANFLSQVVEQRKSDLVDWLDQNLRSSGPLKRGRRKVRISVPKGYIRKLLGSMDEDALGEISHRLEAMGHDQETVDAFFAGRLKPDHHEAVKGRRDALAASDDNQWFTDLEDVHEDDGPAVVIRETITLTDEDIERIAQKVSFTITNVS